MKDLKNGINYWTVILSSLGISYQLRWKHFVKRWPIKSQPFAYIEITSILEAVYGQDYSTVQFYLEPKGEQLKDSDLRGCTANLYFYILLKIKDRPRITLAGLRTIFFIICNQATVFLTGLLFVYLYYTINKLYRVNFRWSQYHP